MLHEFEPRIAKQVGDILRVAGDEIIDAKNFIALFKQTITQMTSKKPRSARNDSPHERATPNGLELQIRLLSKKYRPGMESRQYLRPR